MFIIKTSRNILNHISKFSGGDGQGFCKIFVLCFLSIGHLSTVLALIHPVLSNFPFSHHPPPYLWVAEVGHNASKLISKLQAVQLKGGLQPVSILHSLSLKPPGQEVQVAVRVPDYPMIQLGHLDTVGRQGAGEENNNTLLLSIPVNLYLVADNRPSSTSNLPAPLPCLLT